MFPVVVVAAAAAVLLGAGVAAARALGDRNVRVARALTRGQRVRICDAAEGQSVVVAGRVVQRASLAAPLTGRECVHYRVIIEGPTPRTQSSVVYEDGAGVDFLVEDDSGRAMVTSTGALASLQKIPLRLHDVPRRAALAAITAEHAANHPPEELRLFEGSLCDGDHVVVRGTAHWEPHPDGERNAAHYREQPKRLRLVAPLYLSNRVPEA